MISFLWLFYIQTFLIQVNQACTTAAPYQKWNTPVYDKSPLSGMIMWSRVGVSHTIVSFVKFLSAVFIFVSINSWGKFLFSYSHMHHSQPWHFQEIFWSGCMWEHKCLQDPVQTHYGVRPVRWQAISLKKWLMEPIFREGVCCVLLACRFDSLNFNRPWQNTWSNICT